MPIANQQALPQRINPPGPQQPPAGLINGPGPAPQAAPAPSGPPPGVGGAPRPGGAPQAPGGPQASQGQGPDVPRGKPSSEQLREGMTKVDAMVKRIVHSKETRENVVSMLQASQGSLAQRVGDTAGMVVDTANKQAGIPKRLAGPAIMSAINNVGEVAQAVGGSKMKNRDIQQAFGVALKHAMTTFEVPPEAIQHLSKNMNPEQLKNLGKEFGGGS